MNGELGRENRHMDGALGTSTADKLWSKGQKDAFRILLEIAEVFFESDPRSAELIDNARCG